MDLYGKMKVGKKLENNSEVQKRIKEGGTIV
jgi:hypothetical protein